ncbi:MAG: T9SS type A sorting domain-containing protein, partial [Bacteroidetes bacterium]|nr:T9SS type A sorting domain-containing protein [Bacteroidota bacterium]
STSVAPNFTICNLVPGQEYYLLHDGFAAPGIYSIALSEINLNAGVTNGIINVCYGDTANLFDGISNYQTGGTWTQQIPTLGLQDSFFNTIGLASSIYPFTYTLTDGCATDNETVQLEIYSPSSAGFDGTISVCLNEPFNLVSGLEGNVDFGGSWIDPSNVTLSSSIDTSGTSAGQFEYLYAVSNGVCPFDTASIVVIVDGSCDYLVGMEELQTYIRVYPNPTNGNFEVTISKQLNSRDISVEDLNGKIIHRISNVSEGANLIDISDVLNGIYLIRIKVDSGEYITRIVKN